MNWKLQFNANPPRTAPAITLSLLLAGSACYVPNMLARIPCAALAQARIDRRKSIG